MADISDGPDTPHNKLIHQDANEWPSIAKFADFVCGDVAAIRGCLTWVDELEHQRLDTLEAVGSAVAARNSSAHARLIACRRAQQELMTLAKALGDQTYKTVVTERVSAWVAPLLEDAADVCDRYSQAIMIDTKEWTEEIMTLATDFLGRLNAMKFELRQLMRLLVVPLTLAEAEAKARRPAGTTEGTSVTKPLSNENKTPAEHETGFPPSLRLTPRMKQILKTCKRKHYKGETLARAVGLSYEYARKLFGKLVKAGRLKNDPEKGYRTSVTSV